MTYRLGVDIGGTFTDLALLDARNGRSAIHKRLTTPRDPARAVLEGTVELLAQQKASMAEVETVMHGTTLITNATIERRGAVTGFLVTRGFRDVLDIGKEQRYDLFDLRIRFPDPLVPRPLRREVSERIQFDGTIETPLDDEEVRRAVAELVDEHEIEALAVGLLHSYTNPAHERQIQQLVLREFPSLRLSISSDVCPFMREFERWTTTIVNAYTQPIVDRYLAALESGLKTHGFGGKFYVMMSNGGVATPATARRFPVRLIESGPAAGALMSSYLSQHLTGRPHVLSFDMGGTTAKGSLIRDRLPLRKYDLEVARVHAFKKGSGLPLKIPVIDMIEIGAGGGGIAAVDRRGIIQLGPRSAGADPGPACYGRNGRDATLTDANLVLGYLDPAFFLGGKMRLEPERAESAIQSTVARVLDLPLARAAWGIHETANEDVARAFRVHAAERGFDYRGSSMIAFGGCGPIHAMRIARKLKIPEVVFPSGGGVMSAFGLLVSPLSHETIKSDRLLLDDIGADVFEAKFASSDRRGDVISARRRGWDRRVGRHAAARHALPRPRLRNRGRAAKQRRYQRAPQAVAGAVRGQLCEDLLDELYRAAPRNRELEGSSVRSAALAQRERAYPDRADNRAQAPRPQGAAANISAGEGQLCRVPGLRPVCAADRRAADRTGVDRRE